MQKNEGGKMGGRKAPFLIFYGKRGICGSHFYVAVDNNCYVVVNFF